MLVALIAASATVLATSRPDVLHNPDVFPIGVWLQDPSLAAQYEKAGFNVYIGLWQGPSEEQLAALKAVGMPVICEQNAVGLAHKDDPTIVGWLQQDEPDNAQPQGNGYGPCVPPADIVAKYQAMKKADPTRPVYLGLGQGVANDEWIGRGTGASPDDYKTYVQGGDIVSYDIYPVTSYPKPNSEDYLYLVPKGVDRLQGWVHHAKPTWNDLECTAIDGGKKATPGEIKAELWMSVIHGSRGIVYFVHQFKPAFDAAALLHDPITLAAVTADNAQLESLASVINRGTDVPVTVTTTDAGVKVDAMAKAYQGATYIFAVGMANAATRATFVCGKVGGRHTAEVVDEARSAPLGRGAFSDDFSAYAVHIYRVAQ